MVTEWIVVRGEVIDTSPKAVLYECPNGWCGWIPRTQLSESFRHAQWGDTNLNVARWLVIKHHMDRRGTLTQLAEWRKRYPEK